MKNLGRFFGREAIRIGKIASDIKGATNEEKALHIVEHHLRILLRDSVNRKPRIENIEFSVKPYENDPGRDICLILLYPEDLRGEKINLEIKSSKRGAAEHRAKGRKRLVYRTEVIIVNSERSEKDILKSMRAVIHREIRKIRKDIKKETKKASLEGKP